MARDLIDTLPGMRDLTDESVRRVDLAASKLRNFLEANGYVQVETPIIEDANLFVRKSGGEMASQLYTFTDPAGRTVSLRPEFTPSVIRHFVSSGSDTRVPARYQYSGPVFRYGGGGDRRQDQFTQLGAELIGQNGEDPDAEVIWLAWRGLREIGLPNVRLWIGSIGLLFRILDEFELSESARVFVVGSVNELTSHATDVPGLMGRAEELGLLRTGLGAEAEGALRTAGEGVARDMLQGIIGERITGPTGRRSSQQIVSRLLKKAQEVNDPAQLTSALELFDSLVHLRGKPQAVLSEARSALNGNEIGTGPLEGLARLIEALIERGLDRDSIHLDLGLARGIAYYTGVVFELESAEIGGTVGGGGRYDGLVRALGGADDIPAMGFAYDLDRAVSAVAFRVVEG